MEEIKGKYDNFVPVRPEFIKTTYTQKGEEKVQWWLATVHNDWHSIDNLMYCGGSSWKTYLIDQTLNQIKNLVEVTFTPIIAPVDEVFNDRNWHNGFDGKNCLTFRQKDLPEFFGRAEYRWLNPKDERPGLIVHFYTVSRSVLTNGQQIQLREWFGSQLEKAYTPELLAYLKKDAINRYLSNIDNQIGIMRKGLTAFEAIIHCYKDNEI